MYFSNVLFFFFFLHLFASVNFLTSVRFIEWESEVQHDGELCYIECDQSYQAKGTNDCNNESSYAGGRTIDGSKSTMKEQSSKSWRNGGESYTSLEICHLS